MLFEITVPNAGLWSLAVGLFLLVGSATCWRFAFSCGYQQAERENHGDKYGMAALLSGLVGTVVVGRAVWHFVVSLFG